MKKNISIVLLLLMNFAMIGCKNDPEDDGDDTQDLDNRYTQEYRMSYFEPVALFDSLYITDDELQGYIKKESVFDTTKTEQIRLGRIGIHSSTSNNQFVYPEGNGKFEYSHEFSYIKTKYIAEAYGVYDFSSYLSEVFLLDIQDLENQTLKPQDILNKYGTHAVMAVLEGVYCSLEIEVSSETLSREETQSLMKFLSGYKQSLYTDTDRQSFEEMSKKANIKLSIEANMSAINYLDLRDKLLSLDGEYEMFFKLDGCRAIWDLLPKEYSKAKVLLEEAHSLLSKAN